MIQEIVKNYIHGYWVMNSDAGNDNFSSLSIVAPVPSAPGRGRNCMSVKSLFDTNILVCASNSQTPQKQTIARQYLKHLFSPRKLYMLSLQVINEFCEVL